MALKIIGAGFGRTATNSLKIALEQLGYNPCHHMHEVRADNDQIKWFNQAADGNSMDWDIVFEQFEAAVDWPASAYYMELAEHYPEAKVILSMRDADKWYDSTRETIYALSTSIPSWLLVLIPRLRRLSKMVNKTVWNGVFAGQFESRERSIGIYNEHIEQVKQVIAPQRLLLHEAKDGWKPLCEFLGKPIPQTPYPRVNESAEIKNSIKILTWVSRLPWILALLIGLFLWGINHPI